MYLPPVLTRFKVVIVKEGPDKFMCDRFVEQPEDFVLAWKDQSAFGVVLVVHEKPQETALIKGKCTERK